MPGDFNHLLGIFGDDKQRFVAEGLGLEPLGGGQKGVPVDPQERVLVGDCRAPAGFPPARIFAPAAASVLIPSARPRRTPSPSIGPAGVSWNRFATAFTKFSEAGPREQHDEARIGAKLARPHQAARRELLGQLVPPLFKRSRGE